MSSAYFSRSSYEHEMRNASRRFTSPIGGAAICALLLMAANALTAAPRYADLRQIKPIHGDAAAGLKKAAACFVCHGANGVSTAPMFPRLAGQRADYLYHRLVSFKQADPKDPYYSVSPMKPIAASLSDADMRDLAIFFSSQTPSPTAAAAAISRKGQALFLAGDPTRGIPPCQGCHGTEAGGPSISTGQYAAYPSLRGQYAPYLIARLTSFHKSLPHDSTNDFIMGSVAQTLDDESIQAIATWLSSLRPNGSL
jgi:cytochrome c553